MGVLTVVLEESGRAFCLPIRRLLYSPSALLQSTIKGLPYPSGIHRCISMIWCQVPFRGAGEASRDGLSHLRRIDLGPFRRPLSHKPKCTSRVIRSSDEEVYIRRSLSAIGGGQVTSRRASCQQRAQGISKPSDADPNYGQVPQKFACSWSGLQGWIMIVGGGEVRKL